MEITFPIFFSEQGAIMVNSILPDFVRNSASDKCVEHSGKSMGQVRDSYVFKRMRYNNIYDSLTKPQSVGWAERNPSTGTQLGSDD